MERIIKENQGCEYQVTITDLQGCEKAIGTTTIANEDIIPKTAKERYGRFNKFQGYKR